MTGALFARRYVEAATNLGAVIATRGKLRRALHLFHGAWRGIFARK